LRNPAKRLAALRASADPQAQFLWACFRDLFHYTAYQLERHRRQCARRGLRHPLGLRLDQGPFETWQAGRLEAGGRQWIAEDIKAGKAMSDVPAPAWVLDGGDAGVHAASSGSWSPSLGNEPAAALLDARCISRQLFPDRAAMARKF
jgi:3-hydroxyacyl-CoA dehydrogenase